MLSVLEELDRQCAAITDQDLRRVERVLTPSKPGETILGTAHNVEARRWWALALVLQGQSYSWAHKVTFELDNEEEMAEARRQSHRLDQMSKLARSAFWIQVQEDTGGSAWETDSVFGVRTEWVLVTKPDRKSAIGQMLGGLLGSAAGGIIMSEGGLRFGGADSDDDDKDNE